MGQETVDQLQETANKLKINPWSLRAKALSEENNAYNSKGFTKHVKVHVQNASRRTRGVYVRTRFPGWYFFHSE